LWCKIEITGRNKKKVKLKVPKNTKPGTKMRVKDLWELWEWKTGNLVVVLEAKMPKTISEVDSSMLERIAENVSY
jgi:DnaJ-class molecular chaperone